VVRSQGGRRPHTANITACFYPKRARRDAALGDPSLHLVRLISKHADIWRRVSVMKRRKQLALPRTALNECELVACVTHLQTEIAWLQAELTTTEHSLRAARDEASKQHDRFLLDLVAIGLHSRLDLRVRRPIIEPARVS
jgi:hypothetical protein